MAYADETLNTLSNTSGLTGYLAKLRGNRSAFNTGQRSEEQSFMDRYSAAIAGQPTVSALYGKIGQELGLPQLQRTATGLNETVANIPATYKAATRGFDVNANQQSRIIGTKQAALSPLAQQATTQAQTAEGQAKDMLSMQLAQQEKELMPYEREYGILQDRLARESTGYSEDNEAELNTLITKLQSGVTLTEGERNRAQELAVLEKTYQNQLALQKQSQEFTSSENSKNRLLDLAKLYYS